MQQHASTKAPLPADRAGKYLTFSLEDEEFGIEILQIKEIIGMMPIASVPKTPDYVQGVINLRGRVIPVIDLRRRFGLQAVESTERTCIVVVEAGGGLSGADLLTGLVVDSVSEVVTIRAEDTEDAPVFGAQMDTAYLLGMAKIEDRVRLLLDLAPVLNINELESVCKAA